MKPDISEFSYGFALTSELVSRFGWKAIGAPVFPSLIEEGKVGYDVKIPGLPLFLQFKLCDEMIKGTASQANLLGVPHLRMHLRPRRHSDQHDLLLALERKGNAVYYACPEFVRAADLNDAYSSSTVASHSAFWSPLAVGPLPDEKDHHIAFKPGAATGYFCSDPVQVGRTNAEQLIGRMFEGLRAERARVPTQDYFRALAEELLSIYAAVRTSEGEAFRDFELRRRAERDPQDEVAFITQALFGCVMVFVPQKR